MDASWKMFLAFNASQARVKENELLKSTDKNISDEKILEAQNRISTLENNLKKSEGITIIWDNINLGSFK